MSDRIYCCEFCGNKIDRDLNAAINLREYTVRYTGINAGGDDKVHVNNLLLIGGRLRNQNQTKNLHL